MLNGKQELIDYFSVFRPEYVEFATGELYVKKIYTLKQDLETNLNEILNLQDDSIIVNKVYDDLFISFPEPFNLNPKINVQEDLKRKGYNSDNLQDFALDYLILLKTFYKGDSLEKEDALTNFIDKNYDGVDSGLISPALYLLDSDFLVINEKVVNVSCFLSKIINYPLKIDINLKNYIKSNIEYKKFIGEISEYIPELSDYQIFNMFIDYINDKKNV